MHIYVYTYPHACPKRGIYIYLCERVCVHRYIYIPSRVCVKKNLHLCQEPHKKTCTEIYKEKGTFKKTPQKRLIWTEKEAEYIREKKPNICRNRSQIVLLYIRLLFPYIFGFFFRIYSASFSGFFFRPAEYIRGKKPNICRNRSQIYTGKEA